PDIVDKKIRFGDLEGDIIIGKNHKGAIVTIVDRLTGYSWAEQLEEKDSDHVADSIIRMLMPFKGKLHTLTFDNGREFAHHEKVSEALGIKIFFAKPYHSWERGANENTNGLYRQYIPKGTDFQTLDKDTLAMASLMINSRPRKKLNFSSPVQEILRIFAPENKFINLLQSCI
ncbi:MAG: IS30 family transposase, partial [Bacteroidales bacterium]|nr:IS30 family transposase [Bacteroidales bacterium]